ncbi:uncharacterized protein STEHIDRAFT_159138 [Stereum hirsutum FP-91666 SS1]|uniref:uncharacterized protein n=1 Tax=Stereum hirsutum (strain FP-91666) TaxID=721885 RepID=UPI000444A17F|nr:uncharacterized protein STEHIDRAFT_159138 [Stereum hirsutum FP-91666 SS1]EIM84467.1 hypothetical protein STEHIDRAFT_159138 [Stereum hirsutum FP-91666 SS1]
MSLALPSLNLLLLLSWPSKLSPFQLFAPVLITPSAVLKTIFLFTKSDLKTILVPVTAFAFLTAPNPSITRLPCTMMWIWLNILQFCVSNQSINPEEDASNKPWRPIPSQRTSVCSARILRWILLPMCLTLSVYLNVLGEGLALAIIFLAHNEHNLGSHWILRNVCNAIGYAAFNAGATSIACPSPDHVIDRRTTMSFACNALIIFTTIYAQDFRDAEGDDVLGRLTVPLVWPEHSRIAILASVTLWSVGLSIACNVNVVVAVAFSLSGFSVGLSFYRKRSAEEDRRTYVWYNIWLAVAQVVHCPAVLKLLS